MTQTTTGVLVVVASPGDARDERAAVRDALSDWNVHSGRRQQVAVIGWLWERHAIPQLGGRPQAMINRQAVDQADILVAFFDARLGTSTGVDVSGTAEEINRAVAAGKPVHVYFSTEPLSRDVDVEQLEALNNFKAKLAEQGLLGEYNDPDDLAAQVIRAVEADIADHGWSSLTAAGPSAVGARLKWRHEYAQQEKGLDKRGKMTYRTTKNDLIVLNDGQLAAEDLRVQVEPIGGSQFHFDAPEAPVTLPPDSQLSWTLVPMPSWGGSSGNNAQVSAWWREGDQERTGVWTVALNS